MNKREWLHILIKKRGILICLVLLCSTLTVSAEIYYLKDLVNHGLKNSSDIIKSQNSQLNTRDRHLSNYLNILPNATYSMSYIMPARVDEYYSSSLSIGKSIYLNEPTYFDLRRSRLDKKIVSLNHENLEKRTVLQILFAYIDIMQQQKNIQIIEENFKLQKRIHDQVRIQFEKKTKTVYDLQQSQIDTLSTYIQLIELKNSLYKQREDLFLMIKLNDRGYPLENYEFSIIKDFNVEPYSVNKNLTIQSSELKLESSRHTLTQQFLNLFPSLYANYSWSASLANPEFDDTFTKFDDYGESGTFSVNLSYPLFNQFNQGLNYRIARRNYNIEKRDLKDLNEETTQQVKQIISDIESFKQTYELYQQRFDLSRISLQIAEERFVLGIISNLDLDKARMQHLESEYQLINRFYTLIKRQEELNFALSDDILGMW